MPIIYPSSYPTPPFYQRSRHLQTILPVFWRVQGVDFKRERVTTPDDDFLDVDWARQHSKKLLVLTHGLEGHSQKPYMLSMAKLFYMNGYDIMAWNCRSCSGEMNRRLRLYHHGEIEDIAFLVESAVQRFDYQQVMLIGFSMGGNISLKYAAVNPHPLLCKVVAISAPLEMRSSIAILDAASNFLYKNQFLKDLRPKMEWKAQQFPNVVPLNGLKGHTTVSAAEVFFVHINGYADMEDFYKNGSALNFLERIKIPTLLLQAQNDPLLTPACFPIQIAEKQPFIFLEMPPHGGHVGFALRKDKYRWSEYRALEFMLKIEN